VGDVGAGSSCVGPWKLSPGAGVSQVSSQACSLGWEPAAQLASLPMHTSISETYKRFRPPPFLPFAGLKRTATRSQEHVRGPSSALRHHPALKASRSQNRATERARQTRESRQAKALSLPSEKSRLLASGDTARPVHAFRLTSAPSKKTEQRSSGEPRSAHHKSAQSRIEPSSLSLTNPTYSTPPTTLHQTTPTTSHSH